jgi:hypothetical protein
MGDVVVVDVVCVSITDLKDFLKFVHLLDLVVVYVSLLGVFDFLTTRLPVEVAPRALKIYSKRSLSFMLFISSRAWSLKRYIYLSALLMTGR